MCATVDGTGNCTDGKTPSGTLVSDTSHNIYGTTQEGGAHGAPPYGAHSGDGQ